VEKMKFNIKIPATTANIGPGFDSIGMALKLYNNIIFEEIDSGLEIQTIKKQNIEIPTDESNLIYQTMLKFFDEAGKKLNGIKIIQNDNIPLTRGLGSSAACIVGGILAADKIAKTNLSKKEIAEIAAKYEGHPDNSTPAIFGGMVISTMDEKGKLNFVKIDVPKELTFNVMIPDFTLSTEKARQVIPEYISLKDAVFNLSRTALLVSSIMSGKFENIETAVDDKIHQPYRMSIIPDMEKIFKKAKEFGAFATFLSGAGPTLISITHNNNNFKNNMNEFLDTLNNLWSLDILEPDKTGAVIS